MNDIIPNLRIEKKLVAKGKKIEVKIFSGDTLLDKRTSSRLYRFVLVAKSSQSFRLAKAKASLAYNINHEAEYRGVALDLPGAREAYLKKSIRPHAAAFDRECYAKFLADGNFLEWANQAAAKVAELRLEIPRLESGPQPEFDTLRIISWHQTRRNVPSLANYEHLIPVGVIEIPE